MKRFALIVLSIGALSLGACKDTAADDGGEGGSGGGGTGGGGVCDTICQSSVQCDPGEICTDQCCVDWECCIPGECPSGQFCDQNNCECTGVADACAMTGCDCFIVGDSGMMPTSGGNASITLAAGTTKAISVVVAEDMGQGGRPLPNAEFELSLTDPDTLFSVSGGNLTAAAGAGGDTATLTATILDSAGTALTPAVTCSANLTSLGDAPGTGVRAYLFDDVTGAPVDGATVIIDSDAADGPEGDSFGQLTSDATGLVESGAALDVAGAYNVTVFAPGYNYLSVVGITATDIALPLSPRGANAEIGGFDGRFDFSEYERLYLDNTEQLIKVGIVSASFPLRALLNFDFSIFIGDFDTSLDCTLDPMPVGCYAIEFPGFDAFEVPLPGGVVLDLSTPSIDIKQNFDVTGVPGRRYAWSLGGEAEITDIADLIPTILALAEECTCDDGNPDVCLATCDCDEGCPLSLPIGKIFNGILPLISKFASGVQGNVPMTGDDFDRWSDFVSDEYVERTESTFYPRLDTGTSNWDFGQLALLQNMSEYTAMNTPTLPLDPANLSCAAGVDCGYRMEGLVVLTGVETPGSGFVPLGLTVGLDCTEDGDACTDRPNNEGSFDGEIDSAKVCNYDVDPAQNECVSAAGDGWSGDNRVGLFHAPPHSGLQDGEQITVGIALPLSALFSDDGGIMRISAVVDRAAPTASTFTGATFPATPTLDHPVGGSNSYDITGNNYDLSWVTFASDPDGGGVTTRWNVYYASAGEFVAPTPAGVNPLAPADGTGDIPAGFINATHLGFNVSGAMDLDDYVSNDETTLLDIVGDIEGFGVASANTQTN